MSNQCNTCQSQSPQEVARPENYLNKAEYSEAAAHIAEQIFEILSQHCGPVAQHAAWPSLNHSMEMTDTEFSKDGISIVQRLNYQDGTVEEGIRSAIAYVGQRVDNSCHDGTTTAMMLMAGILKSQLSKNNEDARPPHQLISDLREALGIMKDTLDHSRITLDDYCEMMDIDMALARRAVAYSQAMISSKGDKELSKALATIVAEMPIEKLHGQYIVDHHIHESDTRVEVRRYDANIAIPVMWPIRSTLNHNMETEYKCNNASAIITPDAILGGSPVHMVLGSILSDALRILYDEVNPPSEDDLKLRKETPGYTDPVMNALVTDRKESDLVIIANEIEGRIIDLIGQVNAQMKNCGYAGKFVPIQLMSPDGQADTQYINATLALLEKQPEDLSEACAFGMGPGTNLQDCLIHGLDVHYKSGIQRLYVNGLYERTGDIYVPWYLEHEDAVETQNHPRQKYHKLLCDLEDLIERQKSSHDDGKVTEKAFMHYLTIYRHLICQNWTSLRLGSTTHELRANLSVAEDTFGAVISTIDDGFIFSGLWRWALALQKSGTSQLHKSIEEVLTEILYSVYGLLYEDYRDFTRYKDEPYRDTALSYLDDPVLHLYYYRGTQEDQILVNTKDKLRDQYAKMIESDKAIDEWPEALLQPVQGYYELLRRLGELLPGLLTTATYLTGKKR